MRVELTWAEMQGAALEGVNRRLRGLRGNLPEPNGPPNADLWGIDISAACAEKAVAKALDVYWGESRGPTHSGDVARYEVRWTPRLDGSLILHKADPSERSFVLVCGSPPRLWLPGWILAHDGKVDAHWQTRTGRPCYFVPQDALRPMADLIYAASVTS